MASNRSILGSLCVLIAVSSAELACPTAEASTAAESNRRAAGNGMSLLQVLSVTAQQGGSTCTPLTNHGTHSTVEIEVGTPPQRFQVVADTGSNSVVIPSCICRAYGGCSPSDRCFTGTNKSKTFHMNSAPGETPDELLLTFGSGSIYAVVAQDTVQVGDISAEMHEGILLMTENGLTLPEGVFEGILGLGVPIERGSISSPPEQEVVKRPHLATQNVDGVMKDWLQALCNSAGANASAGNGNAEPQPPNYLQKSAPATLLEQSSKRASVLAADQDLSLAQSPRRRNASQNLPVQEPPSFLEQANINHFSICFNEGADGVLRLGTPAREGALGSIGTTHWAMDFRGMTVGNASAPLTFCQPKALSSSGETDTPCAAIPDSGTTLMMGPYDQLMELFESICDAWDRCSGNYSALVNARNAMREAAIKEYGTVPWDLKMPYKAEVFEAILQDCDSWLTEDHDLDLELPPLHLHIQGAKGTSGKAPSTTLKLNGWSYVLERVEDPSQQPDIEFNNLIKSNKTKVAKRWCSAAFAPLHEVSSIHGPLWILGTPLFYDFEVNYNLGTKPATVYFREVTDEAPCGSCNHSAAVLGQTSNSAGNGKRRMRTPRRLVGKPRMPSFGIPHQL